MPATHCRVGTVAQFSSRAAQRRGSRSLNRESEAVRERIGHLEGEIVGEILNVDFLSPERAAVFKIRGGVRQLQAIAVYYGVAVQLQAGGR